MFSFGFSLDDAKRIVWTFLEGVLGYALATIIGWLPGNPWDWKAFGLGLLAAGWAAIKNGVLADSSNIK